MDKKIKFGRRGTWKELLSRWRIDFPVPPPPFWACPPDVDLWAGEVPTYVPIRTREEFEAIWAEAVAKVPAKDR
jgi:hypothetical protein